MSEHHEEEEEVFSGRLDFAVWRELGGFARPYRKALGGLVAAGLLVALIDGAMPIVTGALIDGAIAGEAGIGGWVAAYGVMLAGIALGIFVLIALAGIVATGVAHDLRQAGFEHLQLLSFSFFDRRPVGWLVTRLTSDCGKLANLLPWFLVDMVWGPALLVGIVVAMLWLHWPLALVVLCVVPPLVIVSWVFQRRLLDSSREIRRTSSQVTAAVNEAIMGVRTTKVLVREHGNLDEFRDLTGTLEGHSVRNALQSALYLPLVISLGSVGVGLALWRGGLELGEGLTLGTLVAFMQYAMLFSMPIQDIARRLTELQAAQAAAERVQGLLATEPEIRDRPAVEAALLEHADRAPAPGRAPDGGLDDVGHIAFRSVAFAYRPDRPVLRGISFEVQRGQTVALVGPTGGGKTTVVSLLARFYDVTGGSVEIDGVDVRDRSLAWLQSSLGIVLQTPHLFSGSIADNIRYGRLEADDEAVRDAARLVRAHAFIEKLPNGYATEVGEGGARLSTGQRQLVALARAVLADPRIFVMDEATSSVDTETESAIQAAIDAVLVGRIAFVIAHRLSTIRKAGLILFIADGRIVERGNHAELMARGGRYRELVEHQHANETARQGLRHRAEPVESHR
jgi:ATP-binding cassette, subfamily B, bacterial